MIDRADVATSKTTSWSRSPSPACHTSDNQIDHQTWKAAYTDRSVCEHLPVFPSGYAPDQHKREKKQANSCTESTCPCSAGYGTWVAVLQYSEKVGDSGVACQHALPTVTAQSDIRIFLLSPPVAVSHNWFPWVRPKTSYSWCCSLCSLSLCLSLSVSGCSSPLHPAPIPPCILGAPRSTRSLLFLPRNPDENPPCPAAQRCLVIPAKMADRPPRPPVSGQQSQCLPSYILSQQHL